MSPAAARSQTPSPSRPLAPRLAFDDDRPSERTLVMAVPARLVARAERVDPRPPVKLSTAKRAIFREQAVAAHLATFRESEVLRVAPPWARSLLAVASGLVAVVLAVGFFVRIEETGRARGVLRIAGGVQTVASQTGGAVLDLGARSGDVVPAGALLGRIDSTATKTALLEAERQIVRADEEVASFVERRDKEQALRIGLLAQRAALLRRRADSQRTSVVKLRERLAAYDRLVAEGLAPALDRGTVDGELAAAIRTGIQVEEEISATQLQSASISAELATELDRRKAEAQKARDRRDALVFQLAQTEVRAPRAGRLEAMVVKVGDVVTVGAPIARLIPEGAPRQVVVFLPEAERAFLKEGADVRIELDQLPSGEFGGLDGQVRRIGSDLATSTEVAEALGESKVEGPSYRVEIELEDGTNLAKLDRFLRPGSLVSARFVLRKRRLASLLLSPLERWLGG